MIKLMMVVIIQCCILSYCSSSFARLFEQQGFSLVWDMLGMGEKKGKEGFEQHSNKKIVRNINL